MVPIASWFGCFPFIRSWSLELDNAVVGAGGARRGARRVRMTAEGATTLRAHSARSFEGSASLTQPPFQFIF